MRELAVAIGLLILSITGWAQAEMSVFTATGRAGVAVTYATDYQAAGINPSNLGWESQYEDMKGAFSTSEFGFSVYTEALTKPVFRDNLKNFDQSDFFTEQDKKDAAAAFTDAPLSLNIDILPVGFYIQPSQKIGGFSFTIKERIQWYSVFNEKVSDLLFLGNNSEYFDIKLDSNDIIIPEDSAGRFDLVSKGLASRPELFSSIMDGSRISLSWVREFNLSYGRQIVANEQIKIYGGIGLKYMMGVAMIDIQSENDVLDGFSAITPDLGFDIGKETPSQQLPTGNAIPSSVGGGIGIDIGASVLLGEKWKFGIALNDMGSITWDGNVYEAKDDTLKSITSEGLNSYNVFAGAGDFLSDSTMFDWSGVEAKRTQLPTVIRFGGSFAPIEQFDVGIDVIIPGNSAGSNIQALYAAVGIDFMPISAIRLSTGLTLGGNYGTNVPVGVAFNLGGGRYELGIASRDALTFFRDKGPNLSMSMGFARFRF